MSVRGNVVFGWIMGAISGTLAGLAVHEGRGLATGSEVAFAVSRPQVRISAEVLATHDKARFLSNAQTQFMSRVSLDEIPQRCRQALVAWEDTRFLSHHGIDWLGLARATVATASLRGIQGGSTLTQQLVKTAFLQSERRGLRGLRRKLREAILAARLEREISKDAVIEDYLNTVYFGDVDGTTIVGIQQAANFYFAKNAKELNLYECAVLVGSLASPNTRNFKAHPGAAHRYALKVVAKAVAHNFVSPREAEASVRTRSKSGHVEFAQADGRHFLSALADEAFRLNLANNDAEVRLVVTIDPRQQLLGENLVCRMIKSPGNADLQGALVTMTPLGEIRALVGGCDFATSSFNRATQAKRQPGSAFKPFVYASAMQAGLSPATIRNDLPLNVDGWQPENSDRRYRGPMSLGAAFAYSVNTVAVRVAQEVGVPAVIRVAHAFGISSNIKPNLTIALGTSEVTLLELTRAFVPFVNEGRRVEAHSITVAISAGRVIFQSPSGNGAIVLNRHAHAEMRELLGAVVKFGTGKRAGPNAVGGKTGTSQGARDGWFVGWRQADSLLTGIWVGNDANDPVPGLSGGGLPAELWRQFSAAAPHDPGVNLAPPIQRNTKKLVSSEPSVTSMPGCQRFPNLC